MDLINKQDLARMLILFMGVNAAKLAEFIASFPCRVTSDIEAAQDVQAANKLKKSLLDALEAEYLTKLGSLILPDGVLTKGANLGQLRILCSELGITDETFVRELLSMYPEEVLVWHIEAHMPKKSWKRPATGARAGARPYRYWPNDL